MLLREVLSALCPTSQRVAIGAAFQTGTDTKRCGRLFVDCTIGGGGHAREILVRNPNACLLGFDADAAAVAAATSALRQHCADARSRVVHSSYVNLVGIVDDWLDAMRRQRLQLRGSGEGKCSVSAQNGPEIHGLDGILVDFGLSSYQLDAAGRGFSFRDDGPLDMRFDSSAAHLPTAAQLVNGLSEGELAQLFTEFGEEPHARFIARAIVTARSAAAITSAAALSAIIADAATTAARAARSKQGRASGGGSGSHPATRCFQALRIAVNRELEAVETLLSTAPFLLAPGGRFAAITFHSLEDRLVKNTFKQLAGKPQAVPAWRSKMRLRVDSGLAGEAAAASGARGISSSSSKARFTFTLPEPHACRASEEEVAANPRARSATLRVIERLA